MIRTLVSIGLAALVVSAAAGSATARPVGKLRATDALTCELGKFDGASLQSRTMVKNTTGRTIKQGAEIRVTFRSSFSTRTVNFTAYRDVHPNQSIAFDDRKTAASCTAVLIRRDIQTDAYSKALRPQRDVRGPGR